MENKKYIIIGIVIILVAVIFFFSGYSYAKKSMLSKKPPSDIEAQLDSGFNSRRNMGSQNGIMRKGGLQGSFMNGEVLSNDGTILIIKLRDGGSRIVFTSKSTKFDKSVDAIMSDVSVGKPVIINGELNSDGSIMANTIQIRKDDNLQK
jgi:hypothetical protein